MALPSFVLRYLYSWLLQHQCKYKHSEKANNVLEEYLNSLCEFPKSISETPRDLWSTIRATCTRSKPFLELQTHMLNGLLDVLQALLFQESYSSHGHTIIGHSFSPKLLLFCFLSQVPIQATEARNLGVTLDFSFSLNPYI